MSIKINKQPYQPKIVLVLSALTYVPGNCDLALSQVLKTHASRISAVIQLENASLSLIGQTARLFALSCPQTATTLASNYWRFVTRQRLKLLSSWDVPLLPVKNINSPDLINWITKYKIDALINLRTRQIFKPNLLNAPRFGCFNLHHGLLPRYRGMYCDLYALHQNRPAGISLHQMDKAVDAGRIIYTHKISSAGQKNYRQYLTQTGPAEALLISRFIDHLAANHRPPPGKKNYHPDVIYTHTPNRKTIKLMQKNGLVL